MKVVFQIVRPGSLNREANPWFRPRESNGTGATGNGRVRSCRDNEARRSRAMPTSRDESSGRQHQGGRRARLEGMSNKSELETHRESQVSQRCCQASPKGMRPSCPLISWGHTDMCAVGVDPGTNPFVFGIRNMVNPLSSLSIEGRFAARRADKAAGKGSWRKQRPSGNRADRSAVVPCESRPTSSRLCVARALEEPQQEESK